MLNFALKNTNEEFLKFTLRNMVFNSTHLSDELFISEVLRRLKVGSHIDLLLNIVGFMDFSHWRQAQLKQFVELVEALLTTPYYTNILVTTQNPVLVICLACEYLTKIGNRKLACTYRRGEPAD